MICWLVACTAMSSRKSFNSSFTETPVALPPPPLNPPPPALPPPLPPPPGGPPCCASTPHGHASSATPRTTVRMQEIRLPSRNIGQMLQGSLMDGFGEAPSRKSLPARCGRMLQEAPKNASVNLKDLRQFRVHHHFQLGAAPKKTPL